jgi:D-alanyl-D-alanine carboxypeptidase
MSTLPIEALEKFAVRLNSNSEVGQLVAGVATRSGETWHSELEGQPAHHYVASGTKMWVATLVTLMVREGLVRWDTPLVEILPREVLHGLNKCGGVDRAPDITLRSIVSHTSGIPNYYRAKALNPSMDIPSVTEADPGWSPEEALDIARAMKAGFRPESGRSQYSFTNYQLVGLAVEALTGLSLADALRSYLWNPLSVQDTGLVTRETVGQHPELAPVLYRKQVYRGAKRMASLGAEGAIWSNTRDSLAFLQNFFWGSLLSDEERLTMTTPVGKIFPGVHYGRGVMSMRIPRLMAPLGPRPLMQGHSGATGYHMYVVPRWDMAIILSINQLANPLLGLRALSEVLRLIAPR